MGRVVKNAQSEWRAGWPVLVMGFIGVFWMSAAAGPLSVLVKPIGEEWGWSRGETTLLLSFNALVILLLGPVAGTAIHKYGTIRMALVSSPLAALALVLIGQSGPNLILWYAGWTFFSIVYLGNNVIVWATAVTSAFDKYRGAALAIALGGSAAGHSLLPVLTLKLYELFGIAGAFSVLGFLLLATCLPLLLVHFFRKDREVRSPQNTVAVPSTLKGFTLGRALSSLRFWQLAFGFMSIGSVVGSVAIQFMSFMNDMGISATMAAWIMSLIGPAILFGRFIPAILLDRCSARQVISPIFFAPVVACFMLVNFDGSILMAMLVVVLVGIAMGAEGDLLAYFVGRYFGKENFAQIYAAMFGLFAIVFGSAPAIVGFVYDWTGSYDTTFLVLGSFLVLGTISMLLLGDYPDRIRSTSVEERSSTTDSLEV